MINYQNKEIYTSQQPQQMKQLLFSDKETIEEHSDARIEVADESKKNILPTLTEDEHQKSLS